LLMSVCCQKTGDNVKKQKAQAASAITVNKRDKQSAEGVPEAPEFEQYFAELLMRNLFVLQRVNREWKAAIHGFPSQSKEIMFLHTKSGNREIWELFLPSNERLDPWFSLLLNGYKLRR
jgi:hypothetical protein